MSIGRFLLAALAGAVLAFWGMFLFVGLGLAPDGTIHFDGRVGGREVVPGYLVFLYLPPLIASILGYLAVRGQKTNA